MPMPINSTIGTNPYSTAQNDNADQARETSTSNRANQDSVSTQVNQHRLQNLPLRVPQIQRRPRLEFFNNVSQSADLPQPFSPIRLVSRTEESHNQEQSVNSPLRSPKRSRLNSVSHSTPDRPIKHSTPLDIAQTPTKNESLSSTAKATLREIGIPEKVISKFETIHAETSGCWALCGSAALAVHMKSVGLTSELHIGDLDVVYTGWNPQETVALDLKTAINSPNSKANEPNGQISLIEIEINKDKKFKIDLVPKKVQFATEFKNINGLEVASLESLKKSYNFTTSVLNKEKSEAARRKLDIISEIEFILNSKSPAK